MSGAVTDLDKISIRPALIAMVIIALVIGVGIAISLYANNLRRQAVIDNYTQETLVLVEQHKEAFAQLFSSTFETCKQELTARQASEAASYKSTDIVCLSAVEALSQLQVDTLLDSSAIAYVKFDKDQYQLIEASGKYNQARSLYDTFYYNHFGYEEAVKSQLSRYVSQDAQILLWQDFINYIPGKEVLVPVEIDGTRVGYVFRGVIER